MNKNNILDCELKIDLDEYSRQDLELIIKYCLDKDITLRQFFEEAIDDFVKFRNLENQQLKFNFGD